METIESMTAQQLKQDLLRNIATPFWVRDIILTLEDKDALKAFQWMSTVAAYAELRMIEATENGKAA